MRPFLQSHPVVGFEQSHLYTVRSFKNILAVIKKREGKVFYL